MSDRVKPTPTSLEQLLDEAEITVHTIPAGTAVVITCPEPLTANQARTLLEQAERVLPGRSIAIAGGGVTVEAQS